MMMKAEKQKKFQNTLGRTRYAPNKQSVFKCNVKTVTEKY